MEIKNKYYSLLVNESNEADITIYGDITSWAWEELGDVSAYNLSKQIEGLDVDTINVHINSYGGEVAEGLAIYNSLKRHKAKVKTYCDGFACSIASVIFMAGYERIMSKASLLMIHNAWTSTMGNANELRKTAEDLDKITSASVNAYMESVNISEEELRELLDNESWLDYNEAIEKGFATSVVAEKKSDNPSQSIRQKLIDMIKEFNCTPKEEPNEEKKAEETVEEPTEEKAEEEIEEITEEEIVEEKIDERAKEFERISKFFNFMTK